MPEIGEWFWQQSNILSLFISGVALIIGVVALIAIIASNPKLRISNLGAQDMVLDDSRRVRDIHISVENEAPRGLLRWVPRKDATNCEVTLRFFERESRTLVLLRPVPARWSLHPEPVDRREIVSARRATLAAGERQPIRIAVKYENDDKLYAFSGESYFTKPLFQLHDFWVGIEGNYVVEVTARSGSVRKTQYFPIQNLGARLDDLTIGNALRNWQPIIPFE